ncbi:MAG: DUF5808 domain-containing protein [Verrucomicrobiota bacterium]
MSKSDVDAFWNDRAHWTFGVYRCKAEPRIVVPKRTPWMGWTVNFAHPLAIPMIALFFAIVLVPIWALGAAGIESSTAIPGSILSSTVVLVMMSLRMASKTT